MATNFPNSVDSLTNPTTSDTLATVSHSGQHTDANDAIEAIQTALLDGAPLHIDDANERVGIGDVTPSYKLDVNGDINTQSSLRIGGDAIGEYTNFTPLIGQGFNMTWGVLTQPQYARVNDTIHYYGNIYISGGTAATGYPVFVQLPVSAAGAGHGYGVGRWYDQSTPDQYILMSQVVNASYLHFRNDGAATYFGETGSGSSMLLAQWDSLSWSITYKAA